MFINYIDLSDEEYKEYKSTDDEIIKLNKMNVFIGKNNSGKSRLMRKVLKQHVDDKIFTNKDDDIKVIQPQVKYFLKDSNEDKVEKFFRNKYLKTWLANSHNYYRNNKEERKLAELVVGISHHGSRLSELIGILDNQNIFRDALNYNYDSGYGLFSGWKNQTFERNKENLSSSYLSILKSKQDVKCQTLYFPSMLSLKKLDNTSDTSVRIIKELKDPNNTHKYTAKHCIEQIKEQLLKLNIQLKYNGNITKFSSFHFTNFCKHFGVKENI